MFDRNKDKIQERNEAPVTSTPQSTAPSSAYQPAAASGSGKAAVLGATIKVKGDISGDENLLIEGQVEGSVTLPAHELTVGKTGKLTADLTAKVIRIDGEVDGDITGREKVFVTSSSKIKGNIVTPKMTLEEGARFKGTIDIDPSHANSNVSAVSLKTASPSDRPV
jgi:cytoskeletal protein CcmA (bactofilin family)